MKILSDGTALRQLSELFDEGVTGAVTDGQLLERFATRRGEASEHAFAALVERHGPVVLRLCRSILRDEHEAQDAFQATFLVLAQRAGSLWVRDSIGPWIHSVAYRVASCARAARSAGNATSGAMPSSLRGGWRSITTRIGKTWRRRSTKRSIDCRSITAPR